MMGIVMPETSWAYKKYNKIISGIYLVLYSSVITMMHGTINIKYYECVPVLLPLLPGMQVLSFLRRIML